MCRTEIATEKFMEGYNCAQSVLYPFCEELDLNRHTALKLSSGFGAGMGRKEEVCGAVTGGIMVIGLKLGRGEDDPNSMLEQTYEKTRALMDFFAEKHGSFICRQLLNGCELNTPDGQKEFKEKKMRQNVCRPFVESVVQFVEEKIIKGA